MPRKKQVKETVDAKLHEHILAENRMLRTQLDNMVDRYNLVDTTQTKTACPAPFLVKESKQHIRTTSDLLRFVSELYMQGYSIIQRKNRDYGDHKNSDPFGNFRRHNLKGFLVRIDDKLARLNTFCDSGKLAVLDESVIDTIVDAANYLAIMAAFIYEQNLEPEAGIDYKASPELTYRQVVGK